MRVHNTLGGSSESAAPQVFPNRDRKEADPSPQRVHEEAALAHPQVLPSLTVGVRKSEVPPRCPPEGPRRDCHTPHE